MTGDPAAPDPRGVERPVSRGKRDRPVSRLAVPPHPQDAPDVKPRRSTVLLRPDQVHSARSPAAVLAGAAHQASVRLGHERPAFLIVAVDPKDAGRVADELD